MTRFSIWVSRHKCQLLRWISSTYREHDRIICDLSQVRSDLRGAESRAAVGEKNVKELLAQIEGLRLQVRVEQESGERAALQLFSEKSLRQSAESRAETYHAELVTALKSSANWASKHVNQRAMYGDAPSAGDAPPEYKQTEPIGRVKPFARDRVRQVTDKTLQSVLGEIRAMPPEPQIGPEFS